MKKKHEFTEFIEKWAKRGIELQLELQESSDEGQCIQLLAKSPFAKDNFNVLMEKNAYGVKLSPDFMSEMTGWEITDGRTVTNDGFIQFAEIIKEFAELTKDILLQKGKYKTEVTKVFGKEEK